MSRRALRRWTVLTALALCALVLAHGVSQLSDRTLPLADAAIIRQQAEQKGLDPALIAAVIYAESKFEPHTSAAGAQGLMQLLPATAEYLAQLSGGRGFTVADLSQPSVNVAYGSYYLRYLLDRYEGDEMLALAAYNGGAANVDRWLAQARASGRELTIATIPFPETREYVRRVLRAQAAYRERYARQLGLA
jgi:soluble lytic murein transglycosylase